MVGLIAKRDFLGEDGRIYKKGEPCDNALRWPYPALRACLNLGIIEDTTGCVRRYFKDRSSTHVTEERQEVEAAQTAPAPDDSSAEPSEEVEVQEAVAEGSPQVELYCAACEKTFKTEHALRAHNGRSHPA